MDRLAKGEGLGKGLTDEHADRALEELRKIQKEMSERLSGRREIFDPGVQLGIGAEKTIEGKLERLTGACIWHSVAQSGDAATHLVAVGAGTRKRDASARPHAVIPEPIGQQLSGAVDGKSPSFASAARA
jgi:hypothetical protein